MLHLGFVSAILGSHSFEEVVNFAGSRGFQCVEMMCWPANNTDARRYAGVSHINVHELTDETTRHIQQYLLQKNVYISALGYYPNPLDPNPEQAAYYREHIKKVIRAAALLKVPVVNTFIGRDPQKSVADNLKLVANLWPDIIKVAEENNIKIGIENCPMYFTADEWPGGKNLAVSPAIWDKLFEIFPTPLLGLNYDPSHLVWQQMDYIKPIYQYKNRLHHIHLKDAKVYKDKLDRVGIMAHPLEYHSPKLPGLGDVDWRQFFSALTDVRYRGPVCIEVEDKAYEGSAADVESAILTSRNYLRQFLS